jgi:leader peptidase (prepilin peptidase)/N-methyltransferase
MAIEIILIFILGLIVGSFLNCVIYRIGKKQSFVRGHSYCPFCKHQLEWYDLIPFFSFLFLKGKCRYCSKPISIQYPLVELAVGTLFVYIYNYFKISLLTNGFYFNFYEALFYCSIAAIFVLIFVYDFKHYLIPDGFTIFGIGLTIAWLGFSYFKGIYNLQDLLLYVYSAVGATLFFFCLWFFTGGRGMGFGDVKLAFFLGLLLGFPNAVVGIFLSFILGAIIGLILVVSRKRKLKSAVPFGPFLVIGSFIALFYGSNIINWYLSLNFAK